MLRAIVTTICILACSQAFARAPKTMSFTQKDGTELIVKFSHKLTSENFAGDQGRCRNADYNQRDKKYVFYSAPSFNPHWDADGNLIWQKIKIGTEEYRVSQMTVFGYDTDFGSRDNYVHNFVFDHHYECTENKNPIRMLVGFEKTNGGISRPSYYVGWERDTDQATLWDSNGWGGWGSAQSIKLKGKVIEWFAE